MTSTAVHTSGRAASAAANRPQEWMPNPIERATAMLSTLLHCRKQADALRACKRSGNESCDAKEAAFVTCSNEHIGLVIVRLPLHAFQFLAPRCATDTAIALHCIGASRQNCRPTCESNTSFWISAPLSLLTPFSVHLQCPGEIEALQRCRRFRPGDDCEAEDMEAMRCASIHVLRAAAAPPTGHAR